MAAGKVSEEVAPFIFGANLFAVIKKSGGFRPVAGINEMLKKSNREEKEKFEFLFSIFEKRKRK